MTDGFKVLIQKGAKDDDDDFLIYIYTCLMGFPQISQINDYMSYLSYYNYYRQIVICHYHKLIYCMSLKNANQLLFSNYLSTYQVIEFIYPFLYGIIF